MTDIDFLDQLTGVHLTRVEGSRQSDDSPGYKRAHHRWSVAPMEEVLSLLKCHT